MKRLSPPSLGFFSAKAQSNKNQKKKEILRRFLSISLSNLRLENNATHSSSTFTHLLKMIRILVMKCHRDEALFASLVNTNTRGFVRTVGRSALGRLGQVDGALRNDRLKSLLTLFKVLRKSREAQPFC